MVWWLSLVILIFAFGFQFTNKRHFSKHLFLATIVLAVVVFVYLTIAQYFVWQNSGTFSKYLVPPYQGWGYVLSYTSTHQAFNYFISLAAALIFLYFTVTLNKRFKNRFFEKEEPYLGALSIFVLSHPLWLYYLSALLTVYLIVQFYFFIKHHVDQRKIREERSALAPRIPMYWLWLPIGILVILIERLF